VLEVNPRASRTVPFVSKATGQPLARYAAMIAAGRRLATLGMPAEPDVDGFFVKEAVLPFYKFPGVDARLGPEMRSTGEVMGHASSFGHAFAKAQMAAGTTLPREGTVFISVNPFDRGAVTKIARDLAQLGFRLIATEGTAQYLGSIGLPVERVARPSDPTPNILDQIRAGEIALIINTPRGGQAHRDGLRLRGAAAAYDVPILTTMSAATAAVQGIRALRKKPLRARSLQAHYAAGKR
jgi:carbamoyl-phosphate synthase large subunit